ncbi:P-loop NTPase family protein [Uliginosibacterium aquaticum]|uniref:Uncharacterized protein n=1 Tax=Uliginosibacterium aquaticum TaxID=2731212 RepID=A0ABX2IJI5_9RHOO|nr:hypothetical protein [Uliginosibacterium aquaticum]NSL55152.1 hypothetical protein [Uliginosibacterium aquaticum]
MDDLFWMPGSFETRRSEAELLRLLEDARSAPDWIAEGVFGRLAEHFLPHADLLIWLDLEWSICAERLGLRARGDAPHMGRTQTAESLESLLNWAGAYETRSNDCSRAGHAALFEQFTGQRLRLRTVEEVRAFAENFATAHFTGL